MRREFRWLSAGPIPAACDLRALGWRLCQQDERDCGMRSCSLLGDASTIALGTWEWLCGNGQASLRRTVLVGIDDTETRTRLLERGFADVVGSSAGIEEIEQRLLREIAVARMMPRSLEVNALHLDLFAREGWCHGKPLGLHPREFAVLWLLAERVGAPVEQDELLRDAFRLSFRPETNRLAVHVSRLRAKLRAVGLDGTIETTEEGRYRLLCEPAGPLMLGGHHADLLLDAHLRLREERRQTVEEDADAARIEA